MQRPTLVPMTEPDPDLTRMWLRGLARDVLEHKGCEGCKRNAAAALEHLGLLEEVLSDLGLPAPPPVEPGSSPQHGDGGYSSSLSITWDEDEP